MIALMMLHPDVQAKIHAELDSVANGRSYIDLNDKVSVMKRDQTWDFKRESNRG